MDRETDVASLFESVSKEKRDRDQNIVQTLKNMQNRHKTRGIESWNWPCEEKNWLTKGCTVLRLTWRSNTGKRENSDIALF